MKKMLVKEFRIPMPMTLAEYQIAQLYTTIETAKLETGGGDGVEEITNEPFENKNFGPFGIRSGQYTLKKLHMDHKLPTIFRILTPKGCLHLQEESWNAFPYCRTILTNEFLNERLIITIESMHLADRGDTVNALHVSPEKLNLREIVFVDIARDQRSDEEPATNHNLVKAVVSKKAGRGNLQPKWYLQHEPVMTCYKLVTVEVKIFGLQNRLEAFILSSQKKIFTAFHRRMYMNIDNWYGLDMEEIRKLERENALELEKQRKCGELRGTSAAD